MAPNRKQRGGWSYKEDRRLLERAKHSRSAEEIANLMNRSPNAIRKKAIRLGEGEGEMRPLVASPGWTREEDELLLALAFSGTSVAGIAKRLKRSNNRANRLKIVLAKSRRVKAKRK